MPEGECNTIQEVKQIYDDYFTDVRELQARRNPMEGLLGFGKRADDDPCHERFADRLGQKLSDFAKTSPASGEVCSVLRFVYEVPHEYKNASMVYWMLLAVQGLTDELIPLLKTEDAASLSALFADLYPKNSRLPSQQKIASRLCLQAGAKEQKGKGIFRSKKRS